MSENVNDNAQDTPEAESEQKQEVESSEQQKGNDSQTSDQKGSLLGTGNQEDNQKDSNVPEKYDLKLPEESLLAEESVEKIASYAKEQGLSNDQAQKLLERDNQMLKEYQEKQRDDMQNQLEQKKGEWLDQTKNDSEIGGDNFNESVELAKRAVDKFGSDEFRQALDDSGLGNHPELVRTFARVGKLISEDTFIKSKAGEVKEKPLEQLFYPGDESK